MSQLYSLHIKRAEGIVWKPGHFHRDKPRLYVQVSLDGNELYCTRKGKRELAPVWDDKYTIKAETPDSVLSLNVRHKGSVLSDSSVGRAEIAIDGLLKGSQPDGDVTLRIKGMEGEDRGAVIVHLTAVDLHQAAATADGHADKELTLGGVLNEEGSTRARVLRGVDAVSGVVTQQKDILSALEGVAFKINKLKEFGDDIAKVHPYANVAWTLVTALYTAVKSQWETDEKLVDLVMVMHDVYSFVDDVSFLKESLQRLDNVIADILNQTIECVIFIREYTGHGFYGRAAIQAWSGNSEKIEALAGAFNSLKDQFDRGLSIQTAFISTKILEGVAELTELDRLKALNAVEMNASSRPLCLAGTRTALLDHITEWLLTPSSENVLWFHGAAGSGKSTISTTIRERFDQLGRLGAFLFFDRNNQVQSDPNAVLRTLAFHLASVHSGIRASTCRELENTNTVSATMETQWEKLILRPLTSAKDHVGGPIIIILDALDECGDAASRRQLLTTFVKQLSRLPRIFRFLITSRKLLDIERVLSQSQNTNVTEIRSADWPSMADVKLYVSAHMAQVRTDHGKDSRWPGETAIQKLAVQSDGLFIWASTAVALIEDAYEPDDQLCKLLHDHHLGRLDELYATVMRSAGHWDDPRFVQNFSKVMGLVILGQVPMTSGAIDALLDMRSHSQSRSILERLQSVLFYNEGQAVTTLHASFAEYLTDRDLCGSERWFLDTDICHREVTTACLRTLQQKLQFNLCGLETSYLAHDVQTRAEIPEDLSYASTFLTDHLVQSAFDVDILTALKQFLYTHLLHWLEVMSVLKILSTASRALSRMTEWVAVHDQDLGAFAADAARFVSAFAPVISHSAPHLYLSAVPLAPKSSQIYQRFSSQYRRTLQFQVGQRSDWPVMINVLQGHMSSVTSVALSQDGARIVSGSFDGTMRVWDAKTGEPVVGPFTNKSGVRSVAFSPDGAHIVSGSNDAKVRVWDAKMAEPVAEPFSGHERAVNSVVFSPDGAYIASGSDDGTVRVWDAKTGEPATEPFTGHKERVHSVAFSPDGARIVSGSDDRTVRVLDAKTAKPVAKPSTGHEHGVNSVAFSLDCAHIVSSSKDMTVRIWDAKTGEPVAEPFTGHEHSVNSVAFSPDGARIVSGSEDRSVRVWYAKTGKLVAEPFTGHDSAVYSVVFSPDGTRIVSGSEDGTARVWEAKMGEPVTEPFTGHKHFVRSVMFSPDGTRIVSGSDDKTVRVWDAKTGESVAEPFNGHKESVNSVAFSPDGSRIVSGSDDMTVRVWDAKTGEPVSEPFTGHEHFIRSVMFSPDGTRIVSGSYNRTVLVCDVKTGKPVAGPFTGHDDLVHSVVFSPDGTRIASGSQDTTVRVWDAQTGEPVAKPFTAHSAVNSVAFCPDGAHIVLGSDDGTVRVWDAKTAEPVAEPFTGHDGAVCSVAFSPDGSHIVSGSRDWTVRIWDAKTGEPVLEPFAGHEGTVYSVAFSPDGTRVVSSSSDRMVRVWDATVRSQSCDESDCSPTDQGSIIYEGFTDKSQLREDGWVVNPRSPPQLLFWLPPWHRRGFWTSRTTTYIGPASTKLDFSRFVHGTRWTECRPETTEG